MAVTWTTQRSGNWSLPSINPASPWYDNGTQTGYARTPGSSANANNDLVIIANGQTLTCDASVTIGDATTATNLAISTAGTGGTGILAVNPGVVLTVVSNVKQGNATWTFTGDIGQTTGLVFAAPGATSLTWSVGDAGSQMNAVVSMQGVAGGHVTVQSTGAVNSYFVSNNYSAQFNLKYVDFTSVGTSSNSYPALDCTPYAAGMITVIDHCTFTNCGYIRTRFCNNAANISITNCAWSGTIASSCVQLSGATTSTGQRVLTGNYLDQSLFSGSNCSNFTITGNVMPTFAGSPSAANPWTQFSGNIIVQKNGSVTTLAGDTSAANTWNLVHVHNTTQLTSVGVLTNNGYRGFNLSGWIIDPGNTNNTNSLFMLSNPSAAYTVTCTDNLMLPVGTGTMLGKHCGQALALQNAGANLTVVWQHNTYITDAQNGIQNGSASYGTTYAGYSGMISSCQSNLAWNAAAGNASVFSRISQSTVSDGCAAANCNHNGHWNPVTANVGTYGTYQGVPGYIDEQTAAPTAPMFSTTSGLGSGDVVVASNPFVDVIMSTGWWRNIAQYAVYAGLPRTAADGGGWVQLSDSYQVKVDAVYNWLSQQPANGNLPAAIASIVNWIKAGWMVNASALNNAGHDGATIGALGYTTEGSPIRARSVRLHQLVGSVGAGGRRGRRGQRYDTAVRGPRR